VTGPRKRGGRPPKDYTDLIGEEFLGVKIRKIYPPGGGPRMVEIQCLLCGTIADKRLQNVVSGHTQSCRCLQITAFLGFHGRRVDKLSEEEIAHIWSARIAGMSRQDLAYSLNMEVATVDVAFRRYQSYVDSLIQSLADGTPIGTIIQGNDLPDQVISYLQKANICIARKRAEEAELLAEEAEEVAYKARWKLDIIQQEWKERERWWYEMIPEEFRRRNGKLEGEFASLYKRCISLQNKVSNDDHRRIIDEFIELAEDTLRARIDRRNVFLRDKRKQRLLAKAA
jgi:hypothetical protein